MFFETRLIQIILLAAIENALEVTSTLSRLMDLQVLFQVATGGKFLGAVGAFKGLISRVDALMPDQIRHLRECLGAARVVARVWLLLVVDPGVLLERRVLRKGLVTGLAKK